MALAIYLANRHGYENLPPIAILVDSVTDCAFGLIFYSIEYKAYKLTALARAQAFLQYTEEQGITNGDVRALPTAQTIKLQEQFFALPLNKQANYYDRFTENTRR